MAEVREDERSEAHAVEPVQRGGVRRRLDRARAVAGVEHLAEQPLQVDRLRRRALHAAPLAADARLDRAEQARPPARRGENREEQERRRRLPVRAGDAGDLELLGRMAEELVGRGRHRGARIGDDDLRHRSSSGRSTTSAAAPRSTASAAKSCPSACAPGTQKNAAPARNRPRVVCEVGQLDRSAPDDIDRPDRGGEALEIHHRPASLPPRPDRLAAPDPAGLPGIAGRSPRSARTQARRRCRRRSRASARRRSRGRQGAGRSPAPCRRTSRRTCRSSRAAPASARCLSCPRRCSRGSRPRLPVPSSATTPFSIV